MADHVLIAYGTRPEAIKLSPVIKELVQRSIPFKTVFTGQHCELYHSIADLIPKPDHCLNIMRKDQSLSDISSRICKSFPKILRDERPRLLVVQGDTTSAFTAALVAFYENVAVGHVEAGLRTYDLKQPFPEEANRQLISHIAYFNWAPTEKAAENLRHENAQNVIVTGNTIVDVCMNYNFKITYGNDVLVTLHRRENFGAPLQSLCEQLEELASRHPALRFVFPMHLNPNVQKMKPILKHVKVIEPLPYESLLTLLATVRCVITDSGGIQEECATFKKKVLVCRNKTERPEGIDAGFARLVGNDIVSHFAWAHDSPLWNGINPYGDGNARKRIVDSIESFMR